jgi:hypothetical protein
LLLLQTNRTIFSCAVSFESKKKKIPDLSLPPCICHGEGKTYKICKCKQKSTHEGKFLAKKSSRE